MLRLCSVASSSLCTSPLLLSSRLTRFYRVPREREPPAPRLIDFPEWPPRNRESWVLNLQQQPVGIIKLNNEIFGKPLRKDLIHRVVVWLLAARRQGTAKGKSRAEVSGSGRKPRKQKGSGQARQGTRRAPHHRGGGRAFPKRPRDFSFQLPKKIRWAAYKSILSAKQREGNLLILDSAKFDSMSGSRLWQTMRLRERGLNKVYVIDGDEGIDPRFQIASRFRGVMKVHRARESNVYEIVRHQTLIITLSGLRCLEARLLGTPKAEPFDWEIGPDKKFKSRLPIAALTQQVQQSQPTPQLQVEAQQSV